MSFLSDLTHGNFGNLGHDITAGFKNDWPYYLAGGAAALTGGLGLAGMGPLAGVLGGADAAGAGAGLFGGAVDVGSATSTAATGSSLVGGGGAAGAAGSGGGFSLPSWMTSNVGGLAGAGVSAAALGMQALKGSSVPGQDQLNKLAGSSQQQQAQLLAQIEQERQAQEARIAPVRDQMIKQYQDFITPLQTGVLPSGAEQALQNAKNDMHTEIKSKYAQLGISGSSAEADALANVDNQVTAQRFTIAQNMAKEADTAIQNALTSLSQMGVADTTATGQSISAATGMSGVQQQIFADLMRTQLEQDKQLQTSISNFAGALGKIGGTQAGTPGPGSWTYTPKAA